jgi:hypothetical protein
MMRTQRRALASVAEKRYSLPHCVYWPPYGVVLTFTICLAPWLK